MKILILGELDQTRPARKMIGPALRHSANYLGIDISTEWIRNQDIELDRICEAQGIFVAPAAPIDDDKKIIEAIRLVREEGIPCLGTCGGFQKIIAEYALNEFLYERIEYREVSPNSTNPLFSELACSLVGKKSEVLISPQSLAASLYGVIRSIENFFCQYGVNPSHLARIGSKDLRVSATDKNEEVRIIEHIDHPFFMGTLFVPQVQSTKDRPHPLITSFLQKSMAGRNR